MCTDYKRLTAEDISEWAESDEGKAFNKAYFQELKEKNLRQEYRYYKFEKWLEKGGDFNKLMYGLFLKHGDEWCEKCSEKGHEPYPNNTLQFIIDYAFRYGKGVTKKTIKIYNFHASFPYNIVEFNGFFFQVVYGQGSFVRIYNKDDGREMLTI
jgi:hypothetical protein